MRTESRDHDFLMVPENAKLLSLARAVRARVGGREGGALRDETGRTHAATNVELCALSMSALELAAANAAATGAQEVRAAVLVAAAPAVTASALALLAELAAPGAVLAVCDQDGRQIALHELRASSS